MALVRLRRPRPRARSSRCSRVVELGDARVERAPRGRSRSSRRPISWRRRAGVVSARSARRRLAWPALARRCGAAPRRRPRARGPASPAAAPRPPGRPRATAAAITISIVRSSLRTPPCRARRDPCSMFERRQTGPARGPERRRTSMKAAARPPRQMAARWIVEGSVPGAEPARWAFSPGCVVWLPSRLKLLDSALKLAVLLRVSSGSGRTRSVAARIVVPERDRTQSRRRVGCTRGAASVVERDAPRGGAARRARARARSPCAPGCPSARSRSRGVVGRRPGSGARSSATRGARARRARRRRERGGDVLAARRRAARSRRSMRSAPQPSRLRRSSAKRRANAASST